MAEFPAGAHRLHAVGVIARWLDEGRRDLPMLALGRRLLEDCDPEVAKIAGSMFGAHL